MMSWFDLMRQAQGSPDLDTLARQFNLSTEQAQKAMAAFLPAFAMGMRQTAELNDPMQVFRGLPASPFAEFWNQTTRAFTPQAQQAGKLVLDQMFGSDDVTRRVAHQAANFAGVGARNHAADAASHGGHIRRRPAQVDDQPGRYGRHDGKSRASSPAAELGRSLGKLAQERIPACPAQKSAATPFEVMMAPFLNPSSSAGSSAKSEPAASETAASEPPPSAEAWEQMMGAGREMQKQYLASLQIDFRQCVESEARRVLKPQACRAHIHERYLGPPGPGRLDQPL